MPFASCSIERGDHQGADATGINRLRTAGGIRYGCRSRDRSVGKQPTINHCCRNRVYASTIVFEAKIRVRQNFVVGSRDACPLAFLGYKPSGRLIGRDLKSRKQLQQREPFWLEAVPKLCRRRTDCRCQIGSEQCRLVKDLFDERPRIAHLLRPVGVQLLTNGVGDQGAVSQSERCQRWAGAGGIRTSARREISR